ncbi:MAG: hypothetical protein AAFU54_18805 [Chloroflexota bacterium]
MAISERAAISNLKFIYAREGDHLKGKLKYFQHRDDRDTHIKQRDELGEPIRRWEDRGLGDNYNSIAQSCQQMATQGLTNDVGARTLVLSPQVEFMAAIPPDMRPAIMAELTDATVERWFEEMRLPTAEYSYVVHQGEVKNDRPDGIEQENKEFTHSHVVIAPTVPGMTQERENYKVYKEQIQQLHQVAAEEMERIWTRELGPERVQDLNQDLEDLTARLKERDLEHTQITPPEQEMTQLDIDEAMLEIYDATGLEPPEDLLERVYDGRAERAAEVDPIEELRALGFEIDDDDPIRDLEELGFDFSGEAEIEVTQDVVDIARELGFDIPEDTVRDLTEEDFDILEEYRELGFIIPRDDTIPSDQLEEIIEELQELGFDIPVDDPLELEPEILEEPDFDLDLD